MTSNPPKSSCSTAALWARFRFSVVGSLLSAPPPHGQLQAALAALAEKTWTHPISGERVRFSRCTIERWYHKARRERNDPVGVLRRAVRKDAGRVSLPPALAQQLRRQYQQHRHWSYQLHYDNLKAWAEKQGDDPSRGLRVCYSTVRRYMQSQGMWRRPRPKPKRSKQTQGQRVAAHRRQAREVRSFEAEYVGSLWHLDFHHGSLKVLSERGLWERPLALCILDDHSRLCCHLQWYLSENAEDLVHGLSQAIQKRGLPRALMTDNGSAMEAEEFQQGLLQLGIVHQPTLPYSPYQNGKQEAFWGVLEGRLMQMLEGYAELSLGFLNQATQAWSEMEYNRREHREIGAAPRERFLRSADVLRESPSSEALREAFRRQTARKQRRSDGTISLEGVRFELPSRYRHFRQVSLRYARWDLSRVDLVDPRSGAILSAIYPLDRTANADGRRATVAPLQQDPGGCSADNLSAKDQVNQADQASGDGSDGPGACGAKPLPPLLKKILEEYSATGLPPAYLPKKPLSDDSSSDDSSSDDSSSDDSSEEGETS